MPSTYSPSLKLELIGTGEQAGTWGITTNNNLGTLLEQAITGVITINMGDATYTLTNYNGLSDEARNAVLMLNGPITAPQNVVIPPQQKVYIVRNRTGNTVTLTANVGATTINIANAASEVVFCDGSNVYSATAFGYVDGDLTVTGNATIQGSVVMATKANASVIIGADSVYGNSSTGQWYIPTGNTSARAANGTNGLFRYNSELQIYEGYQNNVWVKFITANELNYTVNYLVVAGGGGGGSGQSSGFSQAGGGGGAGGYFEGTATFTSGATFTITVGAGGPGGTNGYNSSLSGIFTSVGGGRGANGPLSSPANNGAAGGSGGGASGNGGTGGNGTTSQGNAGGGSIPEQAGGGGGAGTVGSIGTGGAGAASAITGSSTYYAGGGGGGSQYNTGSGGIGGGGNSGIGTAPGSNGGTNLGGGGGGGGVFDAAGGSGGSGVVILSMPTASYTGVTTGSPTVIVSGSSTILRYTISGTYTA